MDRSFSARRILQPWIFHRLALLLACLALMPQPSPAQAEGRSLLGSGRLISNDSIGEMRDRWRSGSVSYSRVWGRDWDGQLPNGFGEILELRLGGQIITPASLRTPSPADRPMANSLAAGLHTHFQRGGIDLSMGADLVVVGPQTGLDRLQNTIHNAMGIVQSSRAVRDNQIADGLHPTLVVEAGRDIALGAATALRPFVEGRAGDETLLRVGADLRIGRIGAGELLIRDTVTGQRYRTIQSSDAQGYTFVMGGDIAHVADSIYLPSNRGLELTDSRTRLRAGLHYEGRHGSSFAGFTWLGPEFRGQPEGQVLGSVRLNFNF